MFFNFRKKLIKPIFKYIYNAISKKFLVIYLNLKDAAYNINKFNYLKIKIFKKKVNFIFLIFIREFILTSGLNNIL
jgi:uncharacterized protein with WD repeat